MLLTFCSNVCSCYYGNFFFSGKSKPINPVSRQLFKVTKKSVNTLEKESCLDNLVDAFYGSATDACVFWYTDIPYPPQYPPEADFNLEKSIDVETATPIPSSLPELASKVNNCGRTHSNITRALCQGS